MQRLKIGCTQCVFKGHQILVGKLCVDGQQLCALLNVCCDNCFNGYKDEQD